MRTRSTPRPRRHRSAVSGRFVTARYARSHPRTTISESVRPPRRPTPAPTETLSRPAMVVVVMADGRRIEI